MLLILVIYLTTVFASSHQKYIDLLPEEEKQEFLDRVARRILENVQHKVPKTSSSAILNDEQLKEHDDFVQSILKQESEQMRRSKGEQINQKNNDENNLEVKPLNTFKVDDNDKIEPPETVAVDFTINETRRRNYNKTLKQNSTRNIRNDVFESMSPIHKRSVLVENERNNINTTIISKNQQEPTTNASIQVKDVPVPYLSSIESTTKLQHWDTTQYNHLTSIKQTNKLNYKLEGEGKKELEYATTTVLNSELKGNDITLATDTYIDNPLTEINIAVTQIDKPKGDDSKSKFSNNKVFHIKTINERSIDNQDDAKNSFTRLADDYLENSTKEPHTEKNEINQTKSNVTSALNLKPFDSADSEGSHQGIAKDNSTLLSTLCDEATTEHDVITVHTTPNVMEHQRKDITTINADIDKVEITTANTSILSVSTPKRVEKTIKQVEKSKHRQKDQELLSKFTSKDLDKVNGKYKGKNLKAELEQKYQDEILNKDKQCYGDYCKHYRVYEVQWPSSSEDDRTFLRSRPVDQAYFLPVYDYSPKKAYYNPENRYGPNLVEENSIEIDKEALRVDATDKENIDNELELPEFIINLGVKVEKFGTYYKKPKNYKVKYVDIYSNHHTKAPQKPNKHITIKSSNEYDEDSTTEYSIHIPNSHELLHPYNNMKKGLKTHIKAIREILYNNRLFGEVPRKTEEDYIKYIDNTDIIGDKHKDYYLRSRFKDKNKLRNHQFGIKKKRKLNKPVHQTQTRNLIDDISEGLQKMWVVFLGMPSEETHPPPKDKANKTGKLDTISKIIEATDESDVFINLEKMKDMNIAKMRRNNYIQMSVYLNMLKKLIVEDSKALKQFDWLGTTVQIQSALEKLKIMIKRLQASKPLHPSDVEILKYVAFLKNFSLEIREANYHKNKLRKKLMLPKNKKRSKKIIKDKGLLNNRVWLYLRTHLPDLTAEEQVNKLESFILDIEDGLYDLHKAIKNIAMITKYKNQNWYANLKDLYLSTDEKTLRELLLHLSVSRLISLIEKSCENGLEEDFVKYMKTHRVESKRTLEETIFVLRIIDEISKDFG